jgi:hypothetical protein
MQRVGCQSLQRETVFVRPTQEAVRAPTPALVVGHGQNPLLNFRPTVVRRINRQAARSGRRVCAVILPGTSLLFEQARRLTWVAQVLLPVCSLR